ncbi:MAG: ABC transporter substrate-binding protein [Eubacteriales bacterium]|nr:ABC transporter substrate-binding protein [Eubacteriales bacterium]
MKKTLSMLLAGAMLATALAGCGNSGGETTPPADGGEAGGTSAAAFKLGGTGPLTGENAIYGQAAKHGAEIAVEEINAAGGDIQFELRYEDDESDAEKAVNAYNTLKDWGMQLSLGSVTSKPCEATSAETYSDRIFALTPSASSTATTEGKDNMFQMCFIDPAQGVMAADKIADKKLGTKIAIIYRNDDVYSSGIHDTFVTEAQSKGLEIVSDTTFTASSATDFNVQLADAKDKGADLVFLPIYYQPASLILSQAKEMNYTPKFFGVDGMDGILTLENFDTSLAEGVMLLTPFNASATDDKAAGFVSKYQEKFGETPNQFAADGYDCVYAYKQALEAAGATPDMSASDLCDKMIEQFTSITFDGLTGTGATWGTDGAVTKDPAVVEIKDGVYVTM